MKTFLSALLVAFLLSGCAASVASKYGTRQKTDKFNNNQTTVTMTGGVIDADYLGIVANPAEFNPFVIRSTSNEILTIGILFSFENNVTITRDKWLNIRKGSLATFLLNDGADKIELKAAKGQIDFLVTAPQSAINTTHYDMGVFEISVEQLRKLANANSVEVRVAGVGSHIDFPRKPNNHVVKNFLPNIKTFYDTEVQPYIK